MCPEAKPVDKHWFRVSLYVLNAYLPHLYFITLHFLSLNCLNEYHLDPPQPLLFMGIRVRVFFLKSFLHVSGWCGMLLCHVSSGEIKKWMVSAVYIKRSICLSTPPPPTLSFYLFHFTFEKPQLCAILKETARWVL